MNKSHLNKITCTLIGAGILGTSSMSAAEDIVDASVDFRIRYENVSQDNALDDADSLTLRTTVNLKTKAVNGWSGVVEFEDVRSVFGLDDYNNTLGMNTDTSVIADPETTELDQGYIQYKGEQVTAKFGRQVITLDDHRFVGHVAWRQDKQTFDAASFVYSPSEKLKVFYAYLAQRNRIFAEERDLNSDDHLLNISYSSSIGKIVGYSYLLELDNSVDNSLNTYGAYLKGSTDVDKTKLLYHVEYATQSAESGESDFDADFFRVEGGVAISGVTAKLGLEVLGSDEGQFGFSTPLATLHKFNGWSDQFLGTPSTGLSDAYFSLAGKAFGGKWLAVYHDFSADESTETVDDLGSEINLQYTKGFKNGMSMGIKYANYSAGDSAAGKVDADKVWVWLGKRF